MKRSNPKFFFCILLLILICFTADAQKELAVIKVRNNHTYYFSEGKTILCKTAYGNDSIKVKHIGKLSIVNDSVILVGADTLKLKDIVAVKKYYSPASRLGLACLFTYVGVGPIVVAPLGVAGMFWAISQGISEDVAVISAVAFIYIAGYLLDYYTISNSSFFHSFNNVGTKYKLNIIK